MCVDVHCHVHYMPADEMVKGIYRRDLEPNGRFASELTRATNQKQMQNVHECLTSVEQRLRDMDAMGVETQVIYPTLFLVEVTERPDARTIRYYVTQKLLPGPLSYEGGRARYGGSHLLRLLLIKRLQAEHHTLGRIARMLQAASDEQVVEALLAGAAPQPPASEPPANLPEGGGRVELAAGGTLELPDQTLRDPDSRRRLAESLEAVARWLRNTNTERGGDA